jgi:ketosteroid isomerase-like protein
MSQEKVEIIGRGYEHWTATGIPVDMRFAQVWTFRDGQAIRMQMYASPEEAITAAGLSG